MQNIKKCLNIVIILLFSHVKSDISLLFKKQFHSEMIYNKAVDKGIFWISLIPLSIAKKSPTKGS